MLGGSPKWSKFSGTKATEFPKLDMVDLCWFPRYPHGDLPGNPQIDQESDGDTVQGDAQQVEPIARPGTNTPQWCIRSPWVMTDVPILNITQPWMVYGLLDGYYKVMSNIPKMGQLPTPGSTCCFFSLKPVAGSFWDPPKPRNQMSGLASSPRRAAWHGSSHHFRMICNVQNPSGKDEGIWGDTDSIRDVKGTPPLAEWWPVKDAKKTCFHSRQTEQENPRICARFCIQI